MNKNDGLYAYLSHHGVEGQRWGVRNGPPYPLSSKRKDKKERKDVSKYFKQNIKSGKDRPQRSAVEVLTKDASTVVDDAISLRKDILNVQKSKKQSKISVDVVDMPDEDLQNAIKRLNMEKQYKDLLVGNDAGFDRVLSVLEIAGDVSAILATTAGITSIIYNLLKG